MKMEGIDRREGNNEESCSRVLERVCLGGKGGKGGFRAEFKSRCNWRSWLVQPGPFIILSLYKRLDI